MADVLNRASSPQAKIALFRSLFRGRQDVYPRRFESRTTGRSGYAPACANEWVRGICEKPRIKCAECPNQRFLPVTDETIRWHLSGHDAQGQPFVAGVYPLISPNDTRRVPLSSDSTVRGKPVIRASFTRLGLLEPEVSLDRLHESSASACRGSAGPTSCCHADQ